MLPPRRRSKLLPSAALALGTAAALHGCGETLTQVTQSDVVEVRVATDSAAVGVGRKLQPRAYPLDDSGALLVGMSVSWRSTDAQIASVDDDGVVTGMVEGNVRVVASIGSLADTTVVTVAPPPVLTLSKDSVGFDVAAGGADPAPDTVFITNTGGLTLSGLSVDSIVYTGNTSGWLSAQLSSPVAPASLRVTAVPAGITVAGVYAAEVWLSARDAESSPMAVDATLEVAPGPPLSSGFQIVQGNGQTAVIGTNVSVAPTISLIDQFDNPVAGATIVFTASGDGTATPSSVTTNANGQASTAWTVAASGHTASTQGVFVNTLTASVTGLPPLQFNASAIYSFRTHVNGMWAASGCTGCHGGATPFSGLLLNGTAGENHAALTTDVAPVCDPALTSYRRVRTNGGDNGHDFSILRVFMEATGSDAVTGSDCGPHGSAKVSAANLAILRSWIRNGAPNN